MQSGVSGTKKTANERLNLIVKTMRRSAFEKSIRIPPYSFAIKQNAAFVHTIGGKYYKKIMEVQNESKTK